MKLTDLRSELDAQYSRVDKWLIEDREKLGPDALIALEQVLATNMLAQATLSVNFDDDRFEAWSSLTVQRRAGGPVEPHQTQL